MATYKSFKEAAEALGYETSVSKDVHKKERPPVKLDKSLDDAFKESLKKGKKKTVSHNQSKGTFVEDLLSYNTLLKARKRKGNDQLLRKIYLCDTNYLAK